MAEKTGSVPERLGPYLIEKRLGSGGMGTVYQALDERLDRAVAIKYIRAKSYDNDDMRQRFCREARAAAQLNHPAIVQIFDFVQEEDDDWIVMELVVGRSLSALLKEKRKLDLATGVPVLREVAYGLAEAHRHGVVHRDIKTENVMITTDGRVKILDFGVARRIVADNPKDQALTVDGMIIGTPHAMSPEQANGSPIDHRTDLFSLGSLAYEALTGTSPFKASNPIKTLYRICTYKPPLAHEVNDTIPEELARMIDRLLAKAPEERPQAAREVARFLDRLVGLDVSGYFALVLDDEAGVPTATRVDEASTDRTEKLHGPAAPAPSASQGPASWQGSASSQGPAATPAGRWPEIRQAAVLHVDLGGLRGAVDLYAIRDVFHDLVIAVVERFGGTVVELGDHTVRGLFGAIAASGDDTRRAVRAGREILRQSLGSLPRDDALDLGLAVHAGPVVVDDGNKKSADWRAKRGSGGDHGRGSWDEPATSPRPWSPRPSAAPWSPARRRHRCCATPFAAARSGRWSSLPATRTWASCG